jgi:hypothetical protein
MPVQTRRDRTAFYRERIGARGRLTAMLPYLLIGIALGVATEILARAAGLWRYRHAALPLANVALMFGVVHGGLAYALARHGWISVFLAGAAIGVAYEIVNDQVLKAWTFPGTTLPWLRGSVAVFGVGIAWGFVPVIIVLLQRALA